MIVEIEIHYIVKIDRVLFIKKLGH